MASTGAADITLDDFALSSTGTLAISAALDVTLADFTVSSRVSRSILDADALAEVPDSMPRVAFGMPITRLKFYSIGWLTAHGELDITLDNFTASADSTLGNTGALGGTISDFTLSADGSGGWYVDSVAGNDSNSGRNSGAALQTLAAMDAKSPIAGETVYLKCNSHFREQLTGLATGVTVRSYSTGSRPIINGANIHTNGSWTKTGGRTNIYQKAITTAFDDAGGKAAHRAFEDGTPLKRIGTYTGGTLSALLGTLDSSPGGFIAPTATGGADTIYIHASDSSAVTSNGKVYEVTQRLWAVSLYNYENQAYVYGVEGRNNAHADGQIVVDGKISDCVARNGRVHNVFSRGLCEDVDAIGMEPNNNGTSTSFVTYQDSTSGLTPNRNQLYRRCRAFPGTTVGELGNRNRDTNIGFYAHIAGTEDLGNFYYEECYVDESLTGFDAAQCTSTTYYKCSTGDNVQFVFSPHSGSDDTGTGGFLIVLGGTFKTTGADGQLIHYSDDFEIPDTITLRGVRCYKVNGGLGPFVINISGTTTSITRCTFASSGSGGIPSLVSGIFTFSNNVVYGAGNLLMLRRGTTNVAVPALTADNNCYFNVGSCNFQSGGGASFTDHIGLAAWKLASGKDTNSINQDPQLADPANANFTIGNSTVIALGAGALDDETQDATLMALLAQWELHDSDVL